MPRNDLTPSLKIRELSREDLGEAAQLLGRGMSNNPANIRAFGVLDEGRRCQVLARFFRPVLQGLYKRGLVYGAHCDGALLGVAGVARPGFCQPGTMEKILVIPSLVLGNPIRTAFRVSHWVAEWARRDPVAPHWHLGPVAVDPTAQRQGVGSALLAAFCAHMDAYGALSYLETDRSENIRFYERFGFSVLEESKVLGVPNWFVMRSCVPFAQNLHSMI